VSQWTQWIVMGVAAVLVVAFQEFTRRPAKPLPEGIEKRLAEAKEKRL
jgi:hypothetical protein